MFDEYPRSEIEINESKEKIDNASDIYLRTSIK